MKISDGKSFEKLIVVGSVTVTLCFLFDEQGSPFWMDSVTHRRLMGAKATKSSLQDCHMNLQLATKSVDTLRPKGAF